MLKRIMMVVLVMSFALMFVPQSSARVCVTKLGGTCVLWSGSIICEIAGTGLGDCENVFLGCNVDGSGDFVVACGTPGNDNPAPGINTVYFEGTIGGILDLAYDDCDKNGNAVVQVHAGITQELKDALKAAGACPNPNWSVLDAVPQYANVTDTEYELINGELCAVADAVFNCELPNPETLEWVYYADANPPYYGFEKRQYNCTRIDYNVYKTPVCP